MHRFAPICKAVIVCFGIFPIFQVHAATANQTVTVDYGTIRGPVSYRAAGYLGSDITDSSPSDSVFAAKWQPLKLQLFSWIVPRSSSSAGYTFPGLNRARTMNAYYQIKVYGNPGDMSLGVNSPWGQKIRAIAQAATATGYAKIQMDILNEPDWSGYWPFNGNYNDPAVLQAWRIAYDAARAVNPNLQLVAPNVGAGTIPWLKSTFLPVMKTENRMPDILSWHEINTPIAQIAARIADMRSFLAANAMSVRDISINEYNYSNVHLSPGLSVQFMNQLELGTVQSASRACWEEVSGGSYDCAPHINGLLDLNGNPRSVWWTYKAYADLTGSMVRTTDPGTFASVASKDTAGTHRVLIGSLGGETMLMAQLRNMADGNYTVKVERIPNSGASALTAPAPESQYLAATVQGALDIPVNAVSAHQAYSITLTRSVTGPTPSPSPSPNPTGTRKPGDANGDGLVNGLDYVVWAGKYGQNVSGPTNGDFNNSGHVDGQDYFIWLTNYGT
jgi:hypothetical protein